MKIAHISDIHIKSSHQEHEISKKGLNSLFKKIEEVKPDYIVIAGDIIHNKLSITSELVYMIFWFLDGLKKSSGGVPIDILLGNHDYNVKNLDRKDIFSVLQRQNKLPEGINIIKEEKFIDYSNNFSFHYVPNHLTKIKTPKDKSRTNILIYHGQVLNSVAENGFKFPTGTFSINDFAEHDYVMLGDIHKKQFLTEKIAYAGSLFQQDFGESLKKGFLLWDIKDKDSFEVKFVPVEAGINYYTLRYKEDGLNLDQEMNSNSKIRVISKIPLTLKDKDEILKMLKNKSTDIQFIVETSDEVRLKLKKSLENLNNSESQKRLIKQYCDDNKLDTNSILETFEEIIKEIDPQKNSKSYVWNLNKLSFDNYFSYAENNNIDFDKDGIIGIVGKNFSGKTSLLDILTYALHTKTIRFHSRSADLINTWKDFAGSFVRLVNDNGNILEIDRKLIPVKQKKKNYSKNQTRLALDELNITQEDEIENKKTLQGLIGKEDDFMTLSVMSHDRNDISILFSTPAVLKDMLRRIFSIDVFDSFDDIANKRIKLEEKEIKIQERQLEILNENSKSINEIFDELNVFNEKEKDVLEQLEKIRIFKKDIEAKKELKTLPCRKEEQEKCKFCVDLLSRIGDNSECRADNETELYSSLREIRNKIGECNNSIAELKSVNKQKSSLIEKIKESECIVQKYKDFRVVVGRDGLPSLILKQSLKTLENVINNILSGLVNFQVNIEISDIDGYIYIYIVDARKKLAYMGSGMEKFITELSIRMALSQLCRVPRINIFMMDEVFNVVGDENKSILPDIFAKMKETFKNIIIISQDKEILSCVDYVIHVDKNENDTSIIE